MKKDRPFIWPYAKTLTALDNGRSLDVAEAAPCSPRVAQTTGEGVAGATSLELAARPRPWPMFTGDRLARW